MFYVYFCVFTQHIKKMYTPGWDFVKLIIFTFIKVILNWNLVVVYVKNTVITSTVWDHYLDSCWVPGGFLTIDFALWLQTSTQWGRQTASCYYYGRTVWTCRPLRALWPHFENHCSKFFEYAPKSLLFFMNLPIFFSLIQPGFLQVPLFQVNENNLSLDFTIFVLQALYKIFYF